MAGEAARACQNGTNSRQAAHRRERLRASPGPPRRRARVEPAPEFEPFVAAGAGAQPSQDVEELIRVTDHERASYIWTYYGCDWKDPHLYHMMIGSQIGAEMASWMIVNAVKGVGQP